MNEVESIGHLTQRIQSCDPDAEESSGPSRRYFNHPALMMSPPFNAPWKRGVVANFIASPIT